MSFYSCSGDLLSRRKCMKMNPVETTWNLKPSLTFVPPVPPEDSSSLITAHRLILVEY